VRLLVKRSAVFEILLWCQRILLICAILALGYRGFSALDSWKFQRSKGRELDRIQSGGPPTVSRQSSALADALVGRIEVRRVGLSAMVVEGTTAAALKHAAGHISGTGMPGAAGNVGIAAHRDTFFRPLRNIRKNDIITLTTVNAEYRYRVVSTKVVDPGDVSVLNAGPGEILTLVTCYPFYFVGSARDRFVVRAERII
jgi:sortase A